MWLLIATRTTETPFSIRLSIYFYESHYRNDLSTAGVLRSSCWPSV